MHTEKRNLKRIGMVAVIAIIALIFTAQASVEDEIESFGSVPIRDS